MRIHILVSDYYASNCYILIPDGHPGALVVDPAAGITGQIRKVLDASNARVGAVLATHGHPDHVWDCAQVASWDQPEGGQAPVYVPGPDMYRMEDPAAHIPMPPPFDIGPWVKPQHLVEFPAGSVEVVPGVWMKMVPAPGHSEGSAVFIGHCDIEVLGVEATVDSQIPVPWALSADVLFAGSVGRTDMPGGDETQMRHSLRTISNALDPETILLPGHGPSSKLAHEIASNPYLIRARTVG
ncbi:MBL fold metallo-hydrolase [Schaalia vaccimaxillae]|uniref:MBL fold metallo-hydrolase n=1 Tax=Schaalia vaccimaxillae TaxID=183916 RepID=UPI0003B322C5|nr:MBL fold metallo-hydrolase [Schaalia vaccimaxillae]